MSPLSKKIVQLKVKLVSGTTILNGFMENVSDGEIYLITAPSCSLTNTISTAPMKLIIALSPYETVNFTCKLKWSYRTPPHGLTTSIGVEVINSRLRYYDIFSTQH